jgi:hypothetical protein
MTSHMTTEGQAFAQIDGIGQNTAGSAAWRRSGPSTGCSTESERIIWALFVDEGDTLLVAFDRAERARDVAADGMPAGFEMVRRRSWSLLSIMAQGETWFLDDALTRFFRTLHKRGVFDGYRRVIFYGVGPDCGFAATAPSPASRPARWCSGGRPRGHARSRARALRAALPQRTAPALHRARWASGPPGIATAGQALILHDPTEFAPPPRPRSIPGANVTRVGLPYAGRDFSRILQEARPPCRSCAFLNGGRPTPEAVRAALKEACRRNPGTMVRRTRAALVQGHPRRAGLLAEHGACAHGRQAARAPCWPRRGKPADGRP